MNENLQPYQKSKIEDSQPIKKKKNKKQPIEANTDHIQSCNQETIELKMIEMFDELEITKIQQILKSTQFDIDRSIKALILENNIQQNYNHFHSNEDQDLDQGINTMFENPGQSPFLEQKAKFNKNKLLDKIQNYIFHFNHAVPDYNPFEIQQIFDKDDFPTLNQDKPKNIIQESPQIQEENLIDPDILSELPPDIVEEILNQQSQNISQPKIKTQPNKHLSSEQTQQQAPKNFTEHFLFQEIRKNYPQIELEELLFISKHLDYQYDHLEKFLELHYESFYNKTILQSKKNYPQNTKENEVSQPQVSHQKNYDVDQRDLEKINFDLSFHQLKQKISGVSQQKEIDVLEKKIIQIYQSFFNSQKIDLHGVQANLAEAIVLQYLDYWRDKKVELEIVTGRGLHSKHGKPVLFHRISKLCEEYCLDFKANLHQGKIFVRLHKQKY